jgi:hypothetical protein
MGETLKQAVSAIISARIDLRITGLLGLRRKLFTRQAVGAFKNTAVLPAQD